MEHRLSSQQTAALWALAKGSTRAQAAVAAGVNERTVYKWLCEEAFSQSLRDAQKATWNGVLAALTAEALEAVHFLGNVVRGKAANYRLGIRVKAASVLLNAAGRITASIQLVEQREILDRIEEALGGRDARAETA